MDKHKRSIMKAVTYRIIIIILNFIAVYLLTKNTETSAFFTILNTIYTTIAYYFHERAWEKIEWGRK